MVETDEINIGKKRTRKMKQKAIVLKDRIKKNKK